MIELKDVSVTFKNKKETIKAVDNINLTIEKGEVFGIIGLSGAGKSTLIRTINLLQKPTIGKILIDGRDITNLKGEELRKIRLKIGMIFQHFNLISGKTVAQNIEFALKANGYQKNIINEKISELLTIVGLEEKANAYPANLSGGQKQRVGIARALANNPEILLCDEATSALDLETTEDILNLLKDINLRYGITIVFITHEMEVAKKIFSRVAVMNNGKMVESGNIYDIFSNPRNAITKSLVDKNFNINLPKEVLESISSKFLLKIYYRGKDSADPVISNVSKLFNVKISIIHGKIDYINGNPLGILIVNIVGNINDVKGSVNFIKDYVWKVEYISLSEGEEEKIG